MALDELAIRAQVLAVIDGLNFDAVLLNHDPVNAEYLVDPDTQRYDAITIECGDEDGRGQITISKISSPEGDEMGGSYRVDWMHVIRVYMTTRTFTYDHILARCITIVETLLTHQTLGGIVDMLWSPPDLVEIESYVMGSEGIWVASITCGWSQFFSVVQT